MTTTSMNIDTITRPSFDIIYSRYCIVRNFLLIWLESRAKQSNKEYRNTLEQLQSIVNNVNNYLNIQAIDLIF